MKKIFTLLYLCCVLFIYSQNVGINTSAPQTTFHIDAAKNNENLPPTSITVVDDFSITNKGRIGIGTTTPRSTVEIMAKDNSVNSTVAEGILIPRVTRERAKAMMGIEEGTLIFVNDATGYNTDNAPGKAIYISKPGLYYFNGTDWAMFQTVSTNIDGSEDGVSIRKVKWFGNVMNATSEELQCGKFKFRIYNDGVGNYQPQWNLVNPLSVTVQGAYRNIWENNNRGFVNVSRTFASTSVYTAVSSTYFIPTNDIHDFYITYPGDTDYYHITFARIENTTAAGVSDNLNVITCKRH